MCRLLLLLAMMHVLYSASNALRAARRSAWSPSRAMLSSRVFSSAETGSDAGSGGGQLLKNFVTNKIEQDLSENKNGGRVVTRFPPEPNGYLHLGHAKSVNINFGLAKAYKGVTHMRFDDTNPAKEEMEYVNSILEDVRWLVNTEKKTGPEVDAPWFGEIRHASDYFPIMYEAAEYLIQQGLAYVDDSTPEEMKELRGTLTEPGKDSVYRSRSVEENLQRFRDMRDGKLPDGTCVLRAKIDMSSPNLNMRDPAMYRIKRAEHPLTGDQWCIYPMYDFAHSLSDALEGITHSLCTLEFKDHRPLYDWVIDNLRGSGLLPNSDQGWRPEQTEFSRLNIQYTVLSKRKLIQLVTEKHVDGWDDPRMPTISGMRRRGYPAEALRLFCDRMGISKAENNIDLTILEDCVRETLDTEAPRALAVLDPLTITITNWPEDVPEETFTVENHPKKPELGTKEVKLSNRVYINKEDFFDTGPNGDIKPPKGYKRLTPGGTVRLKYGYVVRCDEVIRDAKGQAIELRCVYDPATRAGASPEGSIKAKGIVQWVSEKHAVRADAILYDRLFSHPQPGKEQEDGDFLKDLNPSSRELLKDIVVEQSVTGAKPGDTFQFERVGYFCVDPQGSDKLAFNRVVTLRDTWGADKKAKGKQAPQQQKQQPAKVEPPAEDILRIDLRVGEILSAEKHPDADSLYIETIDCGDPEGPRQIISGLANHIPLDSMAGRKVVVICNLKPSKMRGVVSEGMILAASAQAPDGENEVVELVAPPADAAPGTLVQVEGYGAPQPDTMLKSKSQQEVWKRVVTDLKSDAGLCATYKDKALSTPSGPCTVPSLKGAAIR